MIEEFAYPKVYVASRASVPQRPAMWRTYRACGANIVSTWIDEACEGETADMSELWVRIFREISSCHRLVLYVEPSDLPVKGALIETGMALALDKEVYVVAPEIVCPEHMRKSIGSWTAHPRVKMSNELVDVLFNWEPKA